MLRRALHTTGEQLEREGITAKFDSVLAHAIFAGNSVTHVGGVTLTAARCNEADCSGASAILPCSA
eukprot:7063239-Pyramimonas_sp.AAC.1